MAHSISIYSALCSTSKFVINGVVGDYKDFGEQYDTSPDTAEDYGCGDMQFIAKPHTFGVLEKYGIDIEEYQAICEDLEEGLSFGCCSWCA